MNPAKSNLSNLNSILLGGVFFSIPTHVAPAYVLTGLMLLVWLAQGQYRHRLVALATHPVVWVMLAYDGAYLLGLLWTENMREGWRMIGKQTFFLLFPLYLSCVRREHAKYYLGAFILSVTISELLAYYNWAQKHYFLDWPKGISANKDPMDIAPFVDHIMYSPILALGAYLLGHALLFGAPSARQRWVYGIFLCTMTANIFISGGRAGQVAYFSLMALLVVQRFARRPVLALLGAMGTVVVLFTCAYFLSDTFSTRADLAWQQARDFQTHPNTSVGLRMNWAITAWQLFCEHPLWGVGTGDFTDAFAQLAARIAPGVDTTFNPHNQYLFALTTLGLLGGVTLLSVLFLPLWWWRHQTQPESLPRIRLALVFLFCVINFSESYLWRSNTALMFVVFSAVFYAFPRQGRFDAHLCH